MNPIHVSLVQQSWKLVLPVRDAAAQCFYRNLFEREPALRNLFRGDMEEQGKKLMTMIGAAVAALNRPAELIPAVQDLGARHRGYGVRDEHYDIVGAALLDTLEAALGDAFNRRVREAWTEVYQTLASTMMSAQTAQAA